MYLSKMTGTIGLPRADAHFQAVWARHSRTGFASRTLAQISVPASGAEEIVNSPPTVRTRSRIPTNPIRLDSS